MIFEISCSADLACDQKNSGASMGGPAFFSTFLWGQAGEQELCQKSCLQIFRQASKNFLEKAPPEKSKILIKGGVSKKLTLSLWLRVCLHSFGHLALRWLV